MPCYTATSNLRRAHNKFNPIGINSRAKIIQQRPNLVQELTIYVDFSTYSQKVRFSITLLNASRAFLGIPLQSFGDSFVLCARKI